MGGVERFKGISKDLVYSVSGLVVMHAVIQLIVYPSFNRVLGAKEFGTVLALISLISVMSATFGTAANYSRMVSAQRGRAIKGDYNILLSGIMVLAVPVSVIGMAVMGGGRPWQYIIYILLMCVTVVRYYADVEFRLNINYKSFFLYYVLIAFGYLAGLPAFVHSGFFGVAMLLGEGLAVLYVVVRGHIFKGPILEKSGDFKINMQSFWILSGTEIIATLVLNADRFMLSGLVDSSAVTTFYVASLIGKTISLISVPFNGVLIGHLNRYKGGLKGRTFMFIGVLCVAVSMVAGLICTGVSHVFVKIIYPDVYEAAREYFFIANMGQILYFISSTMTVVLLRFTKEKYQLYINAAYLVAFIGLAIPMTLMLGVTGMGWTLVIVNLVKLLSVTLIGRAIIDGKGNKE